MPEINIGSQCGKLTVIDGPFIGPHNHYLWDVKCKCGMEFKLDRRVLLQHKNGTFKYHAYCLLNRGKDSAGYTGCTGLTGHKFSSIRQKARKRGIPFEITLKDAGEQFEKQKGLCALSGDKLYFDSRRKHEKAKGYSMNASLDRIDSSKGYIKGNVQWVLKPLNMMKAQHTFTELLALCRKVVDYADRKK